MCTSKSTIRNLCVPSLRVLIGFCQDLLVLQWKSNWESLVMVNCENKLTIGHHVKLRLCVMKPLRLTDRSWAVLQNLKTPLNQSRCHRFCRKVRRHRTRPVPKPSRMLLARKINKTTRRRRRHPPVELAKIQIVAGNSQSPQPGLRQRPSLAKLARIQIAAGNRRRFKNQLSELRLLAQALLNRRVPSEAREMQSQFTNRYITQTYSLFVDLCLSIMLITVIIFS